jgi:uncharacterized protein Yka (UPF0111/DUF47 family)
MFNKTRNTQNVQLTISEQIKDVKDCLVSFEAFIRAACTPGTVFETLDSLASAVDERESDVDTIEKSMYREIFKMDLGLAEKNQIAGFVGSICDISDTIENIADKIQIMIMVRKA